MSTLAEREADASAELVPVRDWAAWNLRTEAIALSLRVQPTAFPSPPALVAAWGPNPRDAV